MQLLMTEQLLTTERTFAGTPAYSFAALIGRLLLGWFFLSQAVQRLSEWGATKILVQVKHVPVGMFLLALSLLAMVIGSIGLVSGFKTRFSATVLAICAAIWSVIAHDFWAIHSAMERSSDYLLLSLGVAVIGGLLCLAASGGGRFAIDAMEPSELT